jgi:hypothetical protein
MLPFLNLFEMRQGELEPNANRDGNMQDGRAAYESYKRNFGVDPEEVPVGEWAGRVVFHGGEEAGITDILTNGVDRLKSHKGYFGRGFYAASDPSLAENNYADFRDEGEVGDVLAFRVSPEARILDMRSESDWEIFRNASQDSRLIHRDDFDLIMLRNGIDGLFDRSFGGLVIYNPKSAIPLVTRSGRVAR